MQLAWVSSNHCLVKFIHPTSRCRLSELRMLHNTDKPLSTDICFCRLANHHVFQQLTTNWCPEREEHGYFLTPLFKCTTNPRVATAHRWIMVDVTSKLDKPTGCRTLS